MDPKHSVSLSGHASATGYPSNAVIGGAVSADDDARCVALALGGGGARGLAHLGVLQGFWCICGRPVRIRTHPRSPK